MASQLQLLQEKYNKYKHKYNKPYDFSWEHNVRVGGLGQEFYIPMNFENDLEMLENCIYPKIRGFDDSSQKTWTKLENNKCSLGNTYDHWPNTTQDPKAIVNFSCTVCGKSKVQACDKHYFQFKMCWVKLSFIWNNELHSLCSVDCFNLFTTFPRGFKGRNWKAWNYEINKNKEIKELTRK